MDELRGRDASRRVHRSIACAAAIAVATTGAIAMTQPAAALPVARDAVAAGGAFTGTNPVEVPGPSGLWSAPTGSSSVPMPLSVGSGAGSVVQVPVTPIRTTATVTARGVPVTLLVGAENDAVRPAPRVPEALRTARPTGRLGAVLVQVWTQRAYPSATGSLAAVPVTVFAVDTDGSPLRFSGEARTTSGSSSTDTAVDAPNGVVAFLVGAAGLPVGSGTLALSVAGAHDAAPATVSVPLALLPAAVSQVSATVPFTTVYPDATGYHDSLPITLSATTSTGAALQAQGTAEILRDGKPVATWTVRSTHEVLRWSGRTAAGVQPGAYQLRLSVRGPQGAARTVTRSITVSPKKLTSHVRTVGFSVIGEHGTEKFHDITARNGALHCVTSPTALVCRSSANVSGADSRLTLPPVVLPAAALAAAKYAPLQIRFITKVLALSGSPRWIPAGIRSDPVRPGRAVYRWLTLPKGATEVPITIQLGSSGRVALVSAELQYRYSTLG